MLDFAVKLSMLSSGNLVPEASKASQALTQLQTRAQGLQKLSGRIGAFQKQQSRVEISREKLVQARENVRHLREEMTRAGKPTEEMRRKFAEAQKQAGLLGTDFQAQQKKLAELNSELQKSGVNTSKLISEQSRLASETDKVRAAQDRLTSAQERYASIRRNLSWDNIKGAAIGAMAAYKTLEAPVKLSMDFEAAMARVKAVGFTDGGNLEGFNRMKEQALVLGAATKFTAVQAANAQENLIRGGMSPEEVIKAMPAVLDVAASEGLSIDQAGSIIAKGLGGMNLTADLAPRYADVLAYTSSKSNTNIPMIAEAMKVAAPVAASQNIPLEKIAAYVGVLANKGFEGSEAGNALASSFSRLAKMPKEGQDVLRALRVAIKTRDGNMVELPEIMRQLSERMKGKGAAEKLEYMSTIFGKNFGKHMVAFLDATASGDVAKLETGEFVESFGWSKKMAAINQDTLAGQMDILQSSWDGLRTSIGDIFSPIVRSGVEKLSDLLSQLNALVKGFPVIAKIVAEGLALMAGAKGLAGLYGVVKSLVLLPKALLDMRLAEQAANMAGLACHAGTVATNIGNAATA